jgi:hypothetical protein
MPLMWMYLLVFFVSSFVLNTYLKVVKISSQNEMGLPAFGFGQ